MLRWYMVTFKTKITPIKLQNAIKYSGHIFNNINSSKETSQITKYNQM